MSLLGNQLLNNTTQEGQDNKTIKEQQLIDRKHLGKLIGKGGNNLKRLRNETNTSIKIDHKTCIVTIIEKEDRIAQVQSEINDMDNKVKSKEKRARPTHFLSIPVQSPLLDEKVNELKKFTAIDPKALITTQNLHITLGVMQFSNQIEIDRALKVLREECPPIIEGIMGDDELIVKLNEFKVMKSNPRNARVLYIDPIDETGKGLFGSLCTSIIEKMASTGLFAQKWRPFKPHVTLINTSHSNHSRSFDALPILEEYEGVDFGSVTLKELHLMKMGRTGPNQTYESEGFIHITKKLNI